MAVGRPSLSALVLFVCAAALLPSSAAVRTDEDALFVQRQPSWCARTECKCTAMEPNEDDDDDDYENDSKQVTVRCTFSGEKNVILDPDHVNKNLNLVAIEMYGDGTCNLTVPGKAFWTFVKLGSFAVTGFDAVTVDEYGLQVKNERLKFSVTIGRVGRLFLDTNAVNPKIGVVDVLIEDCNTVELSATVISNLRSFVFRRIENLILAKNTLKHAAGGKVIERVILENLTADKLPSQTFITTIDILSITDCTFGSIEQDAFPVTSMVNVTLTNVTVNRVESKAFTTTLITNLRMIGCRVRIMETNAIMSAVESIHIERSEFKYIRTEAVAVASELVLFNNTFERVTSHGFVLNNLHSVRVGSNAFDWLDADAFFESSANARPNGSELQVRDNVFRQPMNNTWWPVVRLQRSAVETTVTGNRFLGSCGCGPWRFVDVVEDNDTAVGDDGGFADHNYCRPHVMSVGCANVTSDDLLISEFLTVVGCDRNAAVYENCVQARLAASRSEHEIFGNITPSADHGLVTSVVLLVLGGFGIMCAVSAVTWLNARGCFSKIRRHLFPDGDERNGGTRKNSTVSCDSLRRVPTHEYSEVGVQVIIYQDKGTQTLPEELSHEVLQSLREKLDDPDDYAEAREMIEQLYDLIHVEENFGGSGNNSWCSTGGLDDMTSTMTTKAVTVGSMNERNRHVRSVGTGTPSLDRLRPPKINVAAITGNKYRRPPTDLYRPSTDLYRPPTDLYRPPSVGEYMDPADLVYGGCARDEGGDADIYCELADLRGSADGYPPLPPLPNKPT